MECDITVHLTTAHRFECFEEVVGQALLYSCLSRTIILFALTFFYYAIAIVGKGIMFSSCLSVRSFFRSFVVTDLVTFYDIS